MGSICFKKSSEFVDSNLSKHVKTKDEQLFELCVGSWCWAFLNVKLIAAVPGKSWNDSGPLKQPYKIENNEVWGLRGLEGKGPNPVPYFSIRSSVFSLR